MVAAYRIFMGKTLRVFLRVGCKCKSVNPPHFPFCGQYTPLHKISRVEYEAGVLQMTQFGTFLYTEMMILEGKIERCPDSTLTGGEIITADILHRLSIE